jgi:hypothetical protein
VLVQRRARLTRIREIPGWNSAVLTEIFHDSSIRSGLLHLSSFLFYNLQRPVLPFSAK